MNVVVFYGSPRKGNTFLAARLFMDELQKCGEVDFTEFFLPKDLPVFCTGCTLCLGGEHEKCPGAQYVSPMLDAMLRADALVFTTPHYGASGMPGAMKNLFDHLDFLVLNAAPREELFSKKAFVLTTGAGSASAIGPITRVLTHWGVNRVCSLGLRMLTNKWEKMPKSRQAKYEQRLRRAARKFCKVKKGAPSPSSVLFYCMSRFILKRYVGEGNYPYALWKEKGYFEKCPL